MSGRTYDLVHRTTYTYDALGRVLTVTLPKPSSGSTLTFTTAYSYDNFDAGTGLVFTNVTDPNGKLTKLGYDQFGRLLRSVDANNKVTVYGYTKDLLTSITDANNNVTSYSYDGLKRLTRTTFPDALYETSAALVRFLCECRFIAVFCTPGARVLDYKHRRTVRRSAQDEDSLSQENGFFDIVLNVLREGKSHARKGLGQRVIHLRDQRFLVEALAPLRRRGLTRRN